MNPPFVLIFAAHSGTGKTTLLSQVIPYLVQAGVRVGVVKHSHHDLDLDQPGKDSQRLRAAGSVQTVLATPWRSFVFKEKGSRSEPDLASELALLQWDELDMVLVEGFRHAPWPKLELYRRELGHPFLFEQDKQVRALVWNGGDWPDGPAPLPLLDINDPAAVARWIYRHWQHQQGHQD
ncbi:molybdopterin-guanine dinucleotide biosynthesis protein B [Balneatrix alpica]|uniref:Molybdopterin-guanine dinucleotide biosynthesis protein B n=1 Tax=Balneatrix alpica TaxID=75684 RepID=A0ABV5ZF74_9GAMM|nr:molybdopterin-guanine dinucleotide biosynthesis protein B [Balneatrix alpica]